MSSASPDHPTTHPPHWGPPRNTPPPRRAPHHPARGHHTQPTPTDHHAPPPRVTRPRRPHHAGIRPAGRPAQPLHRRNGRPVEQDCRHARTKPQILGLPHRDAGDI